MATLILPTRTDGTPHYDFTVGLEGRVYLVELRWVERSAAWYLSIATEDGTPLLSLRRLVLGMPLTWRFKDARLPPGDFHLVDTGGQDREAGLYDLGGRVLFLYTESADLAGALR